MKDCQRNTAECGPLEKICRKIYYKAKIEFNSSSRCVKNLESVIKEKLSTPSNFEKLLLALHLAQGTLATPDNYQ
jgi:hypothetical protein